jgi:hypothetical protein
LEGMQIALQNGESIWHPERIFATFFTRYHNISAKIFG